MARLDWERDEVLLALDLYVAAGCLDGGPIPGSGDADVQALSNTLQALPLHPMADRLPSFRNADGVALKLANFRAAERNHRMALGEPGASDLPSGMAAGGRMDRMVIAEFYGRWGDLHREASRLRDTLAAGTTSPTAASSPGGSDAPIDGGGATEYEATATPGGRRTRAEALLVQAYADHMKAHGHGVTGRHYEVPGESRPLRADLLVRDLDVLVEAKATVERNAIRLGIGQLLDYRLLDDEHPDLAMLLPLKPSANLLALLASLDIAAIWPYADGYTDTVGRRLSR